ncbi:MAG: PH domain-containing protein [Actinophytocola sp.]|nr:PH domain-containing protein [Actinophytocola sp.]
MPGATIFAAFFVLLCATPLAWSEIWLTPIYLLPISYIVWVVRTRTVADADGLTTRTVFSSRRLAWSELKGLTITSRNEVRAVLTDDSEVRLPTVRTRHLPVLAYVSGGHVTDPTAREAESEESSESSEQDQQAPSQE